MDWGKWGPRVLDAFDDAPALLGIVLFFAAIGALIAWTAWSRRAAAARRAAPPTQQAES